MCCKWCLSYQCDIPFIIYISFEATAASFAKICRISATSSWSTTNIWKETYMFQKRPTKLQKRDIDIWFAASAAQTVASLAATRCVGYIQLRYDNDVNTVLIISKETYTTTKETHTTTKETHTTTKETHTSTKETNTTTNETNTSHWRQLPQPGLERNLQMGPTKETYKKDQQKRPTKETNKRDPTYKRDLQKKGEAVQNVQKGQEESGTRELRTKTHRTHKSIWINESLVNHKSTSNQSSKPCTVLQYPSKKAHRSLLQNIVCFIGLFCKTVPIKKRRQLPQPGLERDLQMRPTKETYKKDHQKRPTKETQQRPTKKTYQTDLQKIPTKETRKRPTQYTYKRDLQKRPTEKPYKTDYQKRPTKETNTHNWQQCALSRPIWAEVRQICEKRHKFIKQDPQRDLYALLVTMCHVSVTHPAKIRHICKKRNTNLKRDLQNTKRETYTYD